MADQRSAELAQQAKRVVSADALLRTPQYSSSRAMSDWIDLFEQARQVYPEFKYLMGARNNPEKMDDWVAEQAAGKAPRPNADDLRKMEEAEKRAPGGAESAFWRRWKRIVDFADDIVEDGRASGGATQMTGTVPSLPPATTSSGASVAEPRRPVDHRPQFVALGDAITRASERRRDLIQRLAAAQTAAEQLAREEEALRVVLAPVAGSDWVTIGEYQEARRAYDDMAGLLGRYTEENRRMSGAVAEANRKRAEARTLVIEQLIEVIRKMWSQYNLQAEPEKSDHERSVAIQAVNDMGAILHDVFAVGWMRIDSGARFDANLMKQAHTQKAKDKSRAGTVAAVLVPGFEDKAAEKVYRAEVEVYVD